jgi:hypothetical protein
MFKVQNISYSVRIMKKGTTEQRDNANRKVLFPSECSENII